MNLCFHLFIFYSGFGGNDNYYGGNEGGYGGGGGGRFGAPGGMGGGPGRFVVHMRGLPFRVTENDIAEVCLIACRSVYLSELRITLLCNVS